MARQASKFIPPAAGLVVTMFYVYILHSETSGQYDIGQSKYRGKRCRQHCREKQYWTGCADDWREVFCQKVETRKEARTLEVKIKKRGAKRFLSNNDA